MGLYFRVNSRRYYEGILVLSYRFSLSSNLHVRIRTLRNPIYGAVVYHVAIVFADCKLDVLPIAVSANAA